MGTPAFKEWAVVVRALLAGEQIVDVRKGGLHEDGRHFGVASTRMWLYPTAEHQRPELLEPAYRRWVDDSVAATLPDRAIRVDGWADVVGTVRLETQAELDKLDSRLIWTREYAAARLRWKRRDPLWVLALRAYRLEEPVVVAWRDEYGGCTSWVELDGLPDDPASCASTPALSDESFRSRLELLERELGRSFDPVATPEG